MAEQGRQQQPDKYIQCSRCNCKYINDPEHIINDFGYTRLNERYKGCIKCRVKKNATYELHHEALYQYRQSYNTKNREKINAYNYEKIECKSCGAKVCRNAMRRHERENGCMDNRFSASSDSA